MACKTYLLTFYSIFSMLESISQNASSGLCAGCKHSCMCTSFNPTKVKAATLRTVAIYLFILFIGHLVQFTVGGNMRVIAWVKSSCPSDCGKVWGDVGYNHRIECPPKQSHIRLSSYSRPRPSLILKVGY